VFHANVYFIMFLTEEHLIMLLQLNFKQNLSYFGNWQNRNNCEVDQRTHNHALALKFQQIQDSNKMMLANLIFFFIFTKSGHFGCSSEFYYF
jgi:hypothetical protein